MKFAITTIIEADNEADARARWKEGEISAMAVINSIPKPVFKIKPEPWPMILLPLKKLAKECDKGAGDIIARTIGPIGGDAFKVWYKKLFGKDCGCGNRQEILNQRWPLEVK